ncbi:hypothetical protein D3P07_00680 [Paenibacillus sp. 1011MAR3C5]|nr:hypothetical protein D3P07_00680 [Paenibacillus sp. 1011MAR3C5]
MATLGSSLTAPESGWQRFDDDDGNIVYDSTWVSWSGANFYKAMSYYTRNANGMVTIPFYGSGFRLISATNHDCASNVRIEIDGVAETISTASTLVYQALVYEKTGLSIGNHTAIITNVSGGVLYIDAIDVDVNGGLGIGFDHNILFFSEPNTAFSIESNPNQTVNAIPKMTSNTVPSGVVSASTTRVGWEPYMSFDRIDTDGNGWTTNEGVKTGWLAYEFPESICIDTYTITAHYSASWVNLAPRDWTFEGSLDGINWKVLETRVNEIAWGPKEKRTFSVRNTRKFKKYRINITAINGGNYLNINEVEMFKGGATLISIRDSVVESDFLNYGLNLQTQKTDVMFIDILQKKRNSTTLGSGKTFTHTVDLNKFRINSIKL